MPLEAWIDRSKSMRASFPVSFLQILLIGAAAIVPATAHPDKIEDRLLMHFAAGNHPVEAGEWPDVTHSCKARVVGWPVVQSIGPAQAMVFNGVTDWLEVPQDPNQPKTAPPVREFSTAVWLRLNETEKTSGICGFQPKKGGAGTGWRITSGGNHFHFSVSTDSGAAGPVTTSISGISGIKPGPWYYVVATYDGSTAKLYLNGRLDADLEPKAPAGNIVYPESSPFTIGAGDPDRKILPMDGALIGLKTYARALTEAEIAEAAEGSAGLLAMPATVNQDLQFVVKPYLQAASSTAMTVMAETNRPSVMSVEYAEFQPLTGQARTTTPAALSTVSLSQLKPHTRYFYRVTCLDGTGNAARSQIGSFQTLPGASDAWAFGILGDTQRNPDVTRKGAEGIFALRPNFMLHVGDVVDDGYAKHQWVFDLMDPCARLFAHVPVFPVIGNHEKNSHFYYDYFHLPEPEYCYTFTCGNAEFFMFDSNKPCDPGSEQYQRMEKALAASTAVWKFAAHHHPCFSSDEDDYGDNHKGSLKEPFTQGDQNARHLVPLYEKYGVDVAFAGHIHSYERTWPILNLSINQQKGVRYIISGGGGGGLESAAPQRAWFSIHVQRGHHYCFATIHDRTIQFKAYDLEGRLFDTFELTKSP
jgi:hypothetical protein